MAAGPERAFRDRFTKRLSQLPNSWWESIQQKTIAGTPDKLGCVNGRFVALEFKASATANVSKLQEYKLQLIAAAGGMGMLVCPENEEEVFSLLLHLSKGKTC